MSYRAPLSEFDFVLNDYLGLAGLRNLPGFGEVTPDLLAAILGEAGRFAEAELIRSTAPAIERGAATIPRLRR